MIEQVTFLLELGSYSRPVPGLGHATRDIAIAKKLKQIVGNEILFITGGAAYELISREGFQALNLYRSPHFTVDAGKLRNRFVWLMSFTTKDPKNCSVIKKM